MPPIHRVPRFDEKAYYVSIETGYNPIHVHNARKLRLLNLAKRAVVAVGIATMTVWALTGWHMGLLQASPEPVPSGVFKWADITPTPDLRWHACWDSYECARLQVPLDWTNSSDPRTVAIAMTKIPASVPETSPEWSGPVLLNPGGPGGSGVQLVLELGKALQGVVGTTHSVIGFDPRGVNNTTPATSCFADDVARKIWNLRAGGRVVGYSGDNYDLGVEYARSTSLGAVCGAGAAGSGADFAGTPNVARDMLAIVEAAWQRVGVDGTTKGLRYWGFSYGTVLGQTFASMFPDRVERVIVDGVVDMDDYYIGGWRHNLDDADKVIDSFFRYCAASPACALNAPTPELVKDRVRNLIASTREQPVPIFGDRAPDWVSDADIRTGIFGSLYSPIVSFPQVADALAALEAGNGSQVAEFLHPSFACECTAEHGPNTGNEAGSNILCQDGGGNNSTLREFASYVEELKSQSETIGGNWARIQLSCVGLRVPAKGLVPWRSGAESGWAGTPWGAKTKFPMLFVSSTLDPVTPLKNARKMMQRFPGAGLLVQDSAGHCSLAAPSACTAEHVRRYFETAEVGVFECAADAKPWDAPMATMEKWVSWSPKMPGGW